MAEDDRVVVGHVLLSRSWVDAREALVEVLVLSPLSVTPARQGRGIGTALVAAAIEAAGRIGVPALFLEGSPDYYSRRGFESAEGQGFRGAIGARARPGFQVVVLEGHQPWMTGALVYCEPFWNHDSVGLRDPELRRIEHMFDSVGPCSPLPSRAGGPSRPRGTRGSPRPAGPARCDPPTHPTGSARRPTGCSTSARPSTAPSPGCVVT